MYLSLVCNRKKNTISCSLNKTIDLFLISYSLNIPYFPYTRKYLYFSHCCVQINVKYLNNIFQLCDCIKVIMGAGVGCDCIIYTFRLVSQKIKSFIGCSLGISESRLNPNWANREFESRLCGLCFIHIWEYYICRSQDAYNFIKFPNKKSGFYTAISTHQLGVAFGFVYVKPWNCFWSIERRISLSMGVSRTRSLVNARSKYCVSSGCF